MKVCFRAVSTVTCPWRASERKRHKVCMTELFLLVQEFFSLSHAKCVTDLAIPIAHSAFRLILQVSDTNPDSPNCREVLGIATQCNRAGTFSFSLDSYPDLNYLSSGKRVKYVHAVVKEDLAHPLSFLYPLIVVIDQAFLVSLQAEVFGTLMV